MRTPGVIWAAATSMALVAAQVAGRAVRDALFLSTFHASALPFAIAAAAALSLAGVLVLSRLMSRNSPKRILPVLFAMSACGFVLEWSLGFTFPSVSAVLVYMHTALFGPALITTFWSLINERFDAHGAKTAVARIAAGSSFGGVLGGIAAWSGSRLLPLPALLLFLATLNVLGLTTTLFLRASGSGALQAPPSSLATVADVVSPLGEIRRAPFLRTLALLVALGAALSTLLDYVFSARAVAEHAAGAPLLSFFAFFWLSVSVLSLLVQLAVGRIVLARLGLAASLAFLPGVVLLGALLGLAVPSLTTAALLRGGEAVQRNTLFRSAYELFYTPIAEERKRGAKALIDVGFDRLGTIAGSAVAAALIRIFVHPTPAMLAVVVLLAVTLLPVTRRLHFGYVSALQESLRAGAQKLDLPSVQDAPRPASEKRDREKLIEHVESLKTAGTTSSAPARASLLDPRAALDAVADLLSRDDGRTRRALGGLTGRGPAVSCAILLLAHQTLHGEALAALRRVAPAVTGQLLDALLDPEMDFVVRRRIPRVLSSCTTQRAADGLLLGMADSRFEVRYQCGRALMRISDTNAQVSFQREKLIDVIQRELAAGKAVLATVAKEDFDDELNPEEQTSLMEMLARDRVDRSLEHVFTILSLHFERDPLRMAFRALHHDDERHRGTALEYLETILPPELREGLWPYFGGAVPLRTARAATEILADLAALAEHPTRPASAAAHRG